MSRESHFHAAVLISAALKIVFVAMSLGLDVLAVCIGVGMRGTDRATKIRIGATFASAEVGMTLVGVALGAAAGKYWGAGVAYFGYAALTSVGLYMIVETMREETGAGFDLSTGWGLMVGALSISLDSLGIGFSILFIGVPLIYSIACIALASVVATTFGLALGQALGARVGARAGLFAGITLACTGMVFAGLQYLHIG